MPATHVAFNTTYPFGAVAGSTPARVLKFAVRKGGVIGLRFSNDEGSADIIVSTRVSADDSSYAATTAALNLVAVTSETIARKVAPRDFRQLLRDGTDLFFEVLAAGGARGMLTITMGDAILLPMVF